MSLKVENLSVSFSSGGHTVTAVDHISFEIPDKTIVGLVGESGSGKSVTAMSVMQLLPPQAVLSGSILWKGQNIMGLSNTQLRSIRGSEMGLIFQNPLAALNPVFSVGNQMIETIVLHQNVSTARARDIAIELLQKVQIPDAALRLDHYPHQFSLGMCQRLMIAITLSMRPKLLIADEPTASLDVTVQAQILTLLNDLKEELDMSILLISHDLGVIAQNCDEMLVMYLGKLIEKGKPSELFKHPMHPYTQALIAAIPSPFSKRSEVTHVLKGDIPSPLHLPSGCRFHPRCPKAFALCSEKEPRLEPVCGREVACFLATEATSNSR